MQARTVTKSRDWAVALDDAQPPPERRGWLGLSMAAAGGVAVLAVAAGLMAPPAPTPSAARTGLPLPAAAADSGAAAPGAPAPAAVVLPPRPAAPTLALAAPPPATDPTAALAPQPQPVPLARAQRDPDAMARLDAAAAAAAAAPPPAGPQVVADNGRGQIEVRDGAGTTQRAELARARVGEADLGLRVLPGARPVPDSGRRVPDGAGGEALALSLTASGTLDSAVQFYRQQWLAEGTAADAVQVLRPGDGQALLRSVSPQGGERTVWIVQNGGALEIVLARVRPGPSAPR